MADRLKKTRPTRRDAVDRARLKLQGDPSHINAREDRLLRETMPEAHGRVVTRGLLAEAGRRGDDRVTLLIPEEAALLKARGGAGTRNPESGLLEFWGGDNGADSQGDKGSEGDQGPGGSSGPGGQGVGPTGHGADSPAGPGNSDGSDRNGLGFRGYNPRSMPSIESLLNTPSGYRAPGYENISIDQYAPPDTWSRLLDVFRMGPPPSYKALGAVPGRYGAPTGRGPGIMGTMAGFLTGQPMGMALGLGMKFDQAMSPETRAASLAENQATGAQNSGGNQQRGASVQEIDAKLAAMRGADAAGSASGANTAATPPPGYTVNPAGQIVPMPGSQGDNRAAWKDPVQNLLADYIWRGPSGRGW